MGKKSKRKIGRLTRDLAHAKRMVSHAESVLFEQHKKIRRFESLIGDRGIPFHSITATRLSSVFSGVDRQDWGTGQKIIVPDGIWPPHHTARRPHADTPSPIRSIELIAEEAVVRHGDQSHKVSGWLLPAAMFVVCDPFADSLEC